MSYIQREQECRDSFGGTGDSSVDQQHCTTICALKCARSSYKPAIFMDSGVLVDALSGMLGREDWALAVGSGRVRGTGTRSSSRSVWGEGLEEVEELQRVKKTQRLSPW